MNHNENNCFIVRSLSSLHIYMYINFTLYYRIWYNEDYVVMDTNTLVTVLKIFSLASIVHLFHMQTSYLW